MKLDVEFCLVEQVIQPWQLGKADGIDDKPRPHRCCSVSRMSAAQDLGVVRYSSRATYFRRAPSLTTMADQMATVSAQLQVYSRLWIAEAFLGTSCPES